MNSFLSKLEDRILDGILWVFTPFIWKKDRDDKSVVLYDLGTSIIVSMIIGSLIGAGTSAVLARKNRKSQENMARKQMSQQKKESEAILEAERQTRTPKEPKNQQLAIQGVPKKAKRTGSLAIRGRGGKGSLRVGGAGNYGARIA